MKALGRLCALISAILIFDSLTANSQQTRQTLVQHVPQTVSTGAAKPVGQLPSIQRLNLSIVLPLRNQDQLRSLLSRLYDPSSPDYHHYLSVAQFADQFGPTAENYQAVVEFAHSNGFEVGQAPVNRMVVPIMGSVAQVEKAFNVRMNIYQHPTEKRTFYSPDREPSLELSTPITHIVGLNNFSLPHPMVVKGGALRNLVSDAIQGSGPGSSYLSSDMRAAYYGQGPLTGSGQTVALFQFDGYDINDLVATLDGTATATGSENNYTLTYTPASTGPTYTIPIQNDLLDNMSGSTTSGSDAEQVIDMAQAIGMAPGVSLVRVYILQQRRPELIKSQRSLRRQCREHLPLWF